MGVEVEGLGWGEGEVDMEEGELEVVVRVAEGFFWVEMVKRKKTKKGCGQVGGIILLGVKEN